MGEATQELYLLDRRDEEERDRLNQQNLSANAVRGGHILDPAIPKQNISRIADIATGTGIWMPDVIAELTASGHPSPEIIGFDISPAQFPKVPLPGTKFVLWDMTKNFPEEYHQSFDLVHIRFAVLTIRVEKVRDLVENVVKLIKPGGYLQWTDYTYMHGAAPIYPAMADGGLSQLKEGNEILEFQAAQGWAKHIIGDVEAALKSLPFAVTSVTDFSDAPLHNPEIRAVVAKWHELTSATILERMLTRKGVDPAEVKRAAAAFRETSIEMTKRGQIFQQTICTLVARRNEDA